MRAPTRFTRAVCAASPADAESEHALAAMNSPASQNVTLGASVAM
jgi:hypothetical protein